jgi:hypothetical protein
MQWQFLQQTFLRKISTAAHNPYHLANFFRAAFSLVKRFAKRNYKSARGCPCHICRVLFFSSCMGKSCFYTTGGYPPEYLIM